MVRVLLRIHIGSRDGLGLWGCCSESLYNIHMEYCEWVIGFRIGSEATTPRKFVGIMYSFVYLRNDDIQRWWVMSVNLVDPFLFLFLILAGLLSFITTPSVRFLLPFFSFFITVCFIFYIIIPRVIVQSTTPMQ